MAQQPPNQTIDPAGQSRQALTELLQLQRDFASEAKRAAESVFDNNIQVQETARAFRDIASSTREFEQNIGGVLSGTKTLASLQKDIANSEKAKNKLLVEARQALNKMNFSQREITQALENQNGLYSLINTSSANLNAAETDLLFLYAEQQNILEEQASEMQILADRAQNIDNAFGLAGGSAEALSGILGKLGGSGLAQRLGIDEAVQGTREFAAGLTDGGVNAATLGDKFKVAGHLAKELGGNLMKSLGPLALIAIAVEELIDAFKLVDGAAGDTAKNLGVSYASAQAMTSEMNNVAMASNDILTSTKNLVAAQNSLNEMFGTTVQFSGKIAEEFATIQQRLGLSEQTMQSFVQLGFNNGKGLEENLSIVNNTVLGLNKQNKIGLGFKTIQESIGKAGSAFRLTMKGSTEEITKSVFNAKKLGLELADMEKTQSSLLDFESSISSELEAELLTGKELNLEKARTAALTGDTATLAAEMSREIGTAADFGNMNFLAQEALAKSFGMSREELAKMLESQESLVKIQKMGFTDMNTAQAEYNKLVDAGASKAELDAKFKDKALQSQLQSVSQQERMEAITNRLKEVFVSLIEPLMPVLEVLGELFEGIVKPLMQIIGPMVKELSSGLMQAFSPIKDIFTSIGDIMTDIFGQSTDLSSVFSTIGKVLGGLLTLVFVPMKAVISFMVQGIKSAVDIVGGFVDIFQGNFAEGMKKIATGIIGFILRPFQFLVDMVTGSINAIIQGVNNIPGVDIDPVSINLADSAVGLLPMAKGGITKGPTKALVGEAGPEAVIPLREFYAKIDELIAATKQGKPVHLDGQKVNSVLGQNLYTVGG